MNYYRAERNLTRDDEACISRSELPPARRDNYYVAVNLALWQQYLDELKAFEAADELEADVTERRWPRVVRRWEAKHRGYSLDDLEAIARAMAIDGFVEQFPDEPRGFIAALLMEERGKPPRA